MTIYGHHEKCDVLKPEPDGSPSLKPCNCRPLLQAPACTGVSASWCPVHGDCVCDRENDELNNIDCPLHSRQSSHALGE